MRLLVRLEKKGLTSRYAVTLRTGHHGPPLFVSRLTMPNLDQAKRFAEQIFGELTWTGEEAETETGQRSATP